MSAQPLRLPFDVVVLPFARRAKSARARHASFLGSQAAAAAAGAQAENIVRSLATHGPQSDWQLHQRTGLLRPSVNRARGWLVDQGYVTDVGFTAGPTGVKNTQWGLTDKGRQLAEEL